MDFTVNMSIEKPTMPPVCGRCMRVVDRSKAYPLMKNGSIVGYRVIYSCHGDQYERDLTAEHFLKMQQDGLPFSPTVFEQEAFVAPSEHQVAKDEMIIQMRSVVDQRMQFIQETLTTCATARMAFGHESPAEWIAENKPTLVMDLSTPKNVDGPIVMTLVTCLGQVLGDFWFSKYLDVNTMSFTPNDSI